MEKSVRGSLFGITRLCRVIPNSDPEGRIFLSAPNNHDRFLYCKPANVHIPGSHFETHPTKLASPAFHKKVTLQCFLFFPEASQLCNKRFCSGAMLIIMQQHDKTNKMISVPSKDSDQLGHLSDQSDQCWWTLTFFTAIHVIFTFWE